MMGAASGGPVAGLMSVVGWRESVAWLGGADLLLAVLVFVVVRDRPAAVNHSAPEAEPQTGGIPGVLRNPQVWINAVYATSISLMFVAFGGLWGASYIQKAYDLSEVAAAGIGSLLFLRGIAGCLFFGWYSDDLGRRKPPMMFAGAGALAALVCLLYFPGIPLAGFELELFLVGFLSSANIISFAVARDLYPKLAGFSIGVLNTCFFAGSAASQPLIGKLLEHCHPSSQRHAGLASLTAGDHRYALSPLVLFMVVGLIASLPARETSTATPSP